MGGFFLGSLAVLILCTFLSLFSALTYYLIKSLSIKNHIFFNSILIIVSFSIFDWIKGNILWGFPWTPMSVIWSSNSLTLAPFSYLGVWGYSLVTYFLVVGIYLLHKSIKLSIYFVLPFILVLLLSNFIPRKFISVAENFHIRLVQPNIKQIDKWDKTKTLTNLNLLINLTRHNHKKNMDLVVWPETAVLFDIMDESSTSLLLQNSFKNIENIIIGGIRKEKKNKNGKIHNSLFLIDNISNTIDYHDKIKLVPFGEYIPFRNVLKNFKILLGGLDFSSGEKLNYLELNNNVKVLPLICYEVIFPKTTSLSKKNFDLIVNITNDAWFGTSRGPYQHLALAKIRTVLEGKYMIRVANTGISTIIDYDGNIVDKINLGKSGVIDKKLVLYKKNTLYSYLGDNIYYVLLVALILILIKINFKYGLKKKYERK
tara:strand:+ start:1565 stop:2848 length:1284 start_codon:yes stop_codon:yes gene_type:complete